MIRTSFHDKNVSKLGTKGTLPTIIKVMYDKHKASLTLTGEELESSSTKTQNWTRMPTLTIAIQHNFRSFSQNHEASKRNQRDTNWKGVCQIIHVCR